MITAETNEPRIRVAMGGGRVFYATLDAAQALKNEHARNREIHPGPTANKNAKPRRMTELAAQVMMNEINRQNHRKRRIAIGSRFGRLVALNIDLEAGIPLKWNCRCDCGAEKKIVGKRLIEGGTQSCGCLRRACTRKLGLSMKGTHWKWKVRKAVGAAKARKAAA